MRLFLFRSDLDERVSAFTQDRSGDVLPPEYKPWIMSGDRPISWIGGPDDRVIRNVICYGYHLVKKQRLTH